MDLDLLQRSITLDIDYIYIYIYLYICIHTFKPKLNSVA
jgi:hypothetical protein